MSRIGAFAGQGRETLDGIRREISMTRQEGARHRPTPPETGLVLDVGSGPAADARADVLVDDDIFDVAERATPGDEAPARPLVVADPQRLPFADASFAYAIAVDVLATVADPGAAGAELSRVAPAGFVQVPSRASGLVYGGATDRWLVDLDGDDLHFAPKDGEPPGGADARAAYDESLAVRIGWAAHRSRWQHSVAWTGAPSLRVDGTPGPTAAPAFDTERTIAHLEEENRRGRLAFMPPGVLELLRCPATHAPLTRRGRWLDCAASSLSYPVVGPVPLLIAAAAVPAG
jgi:hypothetical protein